LDPLLAEAHDTMGMAYSCAAQWELSEKSFRRAIELNPSRSTSYASAAMYLLLPLGRIDEALVNLRRAEEADPLSPQVQGYLGYVLTSAGRYDEAARHCDKLPEDYGLKTYCVGRAWLGKGKIGEVVRMLEPAFQGDVPNGAPIRGVLGCAYARAGRREEAEQMAAASSFNPLNLAPIYGCLGDKDRAFEALDRAAAAGPFRIGRALTWPELALLRGDPRVKTLRKKVGLPE
jgi:tetratricopeptide (TPR) repeat protein